MDVRQAGRKQSKDYFLGKELGAASKVRELGFPKQTVLICCRVAEALLGIANGSLQPISIARCASGVPSVYKPQRTVKGNSSLTFLSVPVGLRHLKIYSSVQCLIKFRMGPYLNEAFHCKSLSFSHSCFPDENSKAWPEGSGCFLLSVCRMLWRVEWVLVQKKNKTRKKYKKPLRDIIKEFKTCYRLNSPLVVTVLFALCPHCFHLDLSHMWLRVYRISSSVCSVYKGLGVVMQPSIRAHKAVKITPQRHDSFGMQSHGLTGRARNQGSNC